MTTFLLIIIAGLLTALSYFYLKNRVLDRLILQSKLEIAASEKRTVESRKQMAKNVADAQKLIDQQIGDVKAEVERVRQHYENEAHKVIEANKSQLDKALGDLGKFNKYASLLDAETEIRKKFAEALEEADTLQNQARTIIEQARTAAEGERLKGTEKARLIYEQADARLKQAVRDAGRIFAEAEKKAKEIAGEAYDALRDKQMLEQAVQAMHNITEGYGDRYIMPTHSLLDDLAVEFGYTSGGESLKSARLLSRWMIERGEAATCEYVEINRRDTAVRFVIDAFNGRVDAILSRVKSDNYGIMEQEIRDAFSLVNLNGKAFRDARILPAYLDARLAELKWAVVVQELARRQMEEQRELKARIRDEEKATREREEQMRRAAKDEELKKKGLEDKERELAQAKVEFEKAAAVDKAEWEQKITEMQLANEGLRKDLATATEKRLTIAQQTKQGHVYIISNVGAFGEGIFKIGQTRRLNKQERVDELGDASVPFDFDVHAWIESENAPVLEHKLQKRFLSMQINKINSRKEFFRVSLNQIREEIEKLKSEKEFTVTHWTDMAAAKHYRETLDIEKDPQKLEKWLKRQEALVEREIRLDGLKISLPDITEPVSEETNA